MLEVLFGTGIRLAELVALKDSDVDFYEGSIKVLGKGAKQRIIPLPKPLIYLLREFIHLKSLQNFDNNSEALIVNNKGKACQPCFYLQHGEKLFDKYIYPGKKESACFKAFLCYKFIKQGADLNAIKELLGHASLAATQVYTHNSIERLKSIYKQAHPKA